MLINNLKSINKKISLAAVIIFTLAVPVKTNAQAALLVLLFGDQVASEDFYFSLKVGGNITNLTNTEQSTSAFGVNFGLLATIKLSDKFYLVPEFAPLSRKGAKNILVHPTGNADLDALLSNTSTSEIQLNYLDIPVMLKYYPVQKINVGIGPYFSFLTSGENFYETNAGDAGDLQILQDIKPDFNNFDYGLMAEIGYAPFRESHSDDLNFHVRFSYGFTDIMKNNPGDQVSNYALQLFVSIPFMKTDEEE